MKKMKKSIVLTVFILTSIAQLTVPAYMIFKKEQCLEKGRKYLFKTAPVDPYDPFRGRYVRLGFEAARDIKNMDKSFKRGQKVYALLKTDKDGFAQIASVTGECPEEGKNDFIEAKVAWSNNLTLPFDRYYMDEYKAPEAERAVAWRRRNNKKQPTAYAVVKVLNGRAAIQDLFIDGKPIKEYLRSTSAKKR